MTPDAGRGRPGTAGGAVVVVLLALALLVGVVLTRGSTAVDERDVRAAAAQPSATPATDGATVLAADGLPGARLGEASEGASLVVGPDVGRDPVVTEADLPGGCDVTRVPPRSVVATGWDALAWVVDGAVAAVVVSVVPGSAPTSGPGSDGASRLPRTWLGPGLGSPLQAVEELTGAATRVHRPLGEDGAAVTVVTVPGDGVDVVFSDVASPGRVSTVEVRHPAGRGCSVEALTEHLDRLRGGPASADPVPVTRAGLPEVPLGMPVTELVELPTVQRQQGDAPGGCTTYLHVDGQGRSTTVEVSDSVVVAVEPVGPVTTDFGVASGDGVDDLAEVFPELAGRSSDLIEQQGATEVELDGVVVTLRLWPDVGWVPEVEAPVEGPLVLHSVGVREAGAEVYPAC